MAVSITPKFSNEQLEALIVAKMRKAEPQILQILQKIGEEFVRNARLNGDYKDRTGNLRNSIGYVILKNGEQLHENFTLAARVSAEGSGKSKTKFTKGSAEGKAIAMEFIKDLLPQFPTGYVLIVVAGMNYAAAVESKGRDVLTGSSKIATRNLKKAMETIQGKLDRL